MRSRRRFALIAGSTVGIALLAISTGPGPFGRRSEATRGLQTAAFERTATVAPMGPLSLGSSVVQDRLEADARQAAKTAVVGEEARRACCGGRRRAGPADHRRTTNA
jgi:hypothetical protein